jgi:hypothetical protein
MSKKAMAKRINIGGKENLNSSGMPLSVVRILTLGWETNLTVT